MEISSPSSLMTSSLEWWRNTLQTGSDQASQIMYSKVTSLIYTFQQSYDDLGTRLVY